MYVVYTELCVWREEKKGPIVVLSIIPQILLRSPKPVSKQNALVPDSLSHVTEP